jgi:hypothetical protein
MMNKVEELIERLEQIASGIQSQHETVMKEHRIEMRRAVRRFLYIFAISIAILWGGLRIHLITGSTFSGREISTIILSTFIITGFALLLILSRLVHKRLIKNTIRSIELFYQIGQLVATLKEGKYNG